MPSSFRQLVKRAPRLRHSISAMLLIAFVVTATGVPLTITNRPHKSNERFPCATSSCGCQSAEQCWRSCCCSTFSERLAWARKHGVRPPDFAIAQARAAGIDVSRFATSKEAKLACHSKSCCDAAPAKVVHSCCSPAKSTQSDRTVIAWQALKCSGHSMNWLAAVPTLVHVRIDFNFQDTPSTWLSPTVSDHAFGTSDLPELPPPERA